MRAWAIRLLAAAALAGFAAAVWFTGPMVGFMDVRPLASPGLRIGLIGAVLFLAVAGTARRFWQHRQAQKRLEQAIAPADPRENDPENHETRMAEALEAFKQASGKPNFLRTLPWYVIIGPKGAGKTTALLHAGLRLPAAPEAEPPVAGVAPTEFCDWWFTEASVLVDTAGRYTSHGPDAAVERKSWLALLALLRRNRVSQPINGVILVFSLEDLLLLGRNELDAHVATIRSRLDEIREGLRIDVPVYVLFTKADLIAGFRESFAPLGEEERQQVWGATLGAAGPDGTEAGRVPDEFDALAARLAEAAADRLNEAREAASRVAVFGFPEQFALLKERVGDFLRRVFQPSSRGAHAPVLRGFYFSSSTQEGSPIEQAAGRAVRLPPAGRARPGDAFFLRHLLPQVVFAESRWVAGNSPARRRAKALRRAAYAALALFGVAALGAWGWSFAANHSLIAATDAALEAGRAEAEPLLNGSPVTMPDLENVVGTLELLRTLPVGYDSAGEPPPPAETFGLGQRARLRSAAETAYARGLERLFRSRLLVELENRIEASMADPAALYEPLKVYLTLGGKAPRTDDALILAWFTTDWQRNLYPGAPNREGRAQLEKHLRAMLALDDAHDPAYELNRQLVESAQRSLARIALPELAAALVRSGFYAADLADLDAAALAGPEAAAVFDTSDGTELGRLRIPALYTKKGFTELFLPQLASVAEKLSDDQWVLGAGGEQVGVEGQLRQLGPKLLDAYGQEFRAAWAAVLDRLKLKQLAGDKPRYSALAIAAAPESPIRRLAEQVTVETSLVDGLFNDRPEAELDKLEDGLNRVGLSLRTAKGQNRAGVASSPSAGQVPGAAIEAQFRAYAVLTEGEPGERPIDALVQNFADIYRSLVLAANSPTQAEQLSANLQLQIANLRANASRFPRPLARMAQAAADEFEGSAAQTSTAELNRALAEEVTKPCEELIGRNYPFDAASDRDVPIADFAQFFRPDGPIDRFFAQNLSPLVDSSGAEWQWRPDTPLGRKLSVATLRAFQAAARIRDAFFPKGASQPAMNLTLTPLSMHGDVDMALLEVGGQIVQSYQSGSVPATFAWPDALSSEAVGLNLTPEIPGRPSSARFEGPWALMRLFDTGTVTANGDAAQARVVIGGRDVTYTIRTDTGANPFLPPAFREFSCPAGL